MGLLNRRGRFPNLGRMMLERKLGCRTQKLEDCDDGNDGLGYSATFPTSKQTQVYNSLTQCITTTENASPNARTLAR